VAASTGDVPYAALRHPLTDPPSEGLPDNQIYPIGQLLSSMYPLPMGNETSKLSPDAPIGDLGGG